MSSPAFGDPGPRLPAWRLLGVLLTLIMLAGIGAVAWGVNELRGGGRETSVYAALGGGAAAVLLFGWLASRAGRRVDYLEGGLVHHKTKRAAILAGFLVLLGVVAALWFYAFPWIDRTFVNRPAVGG